MKNPIAAAVSLLLFSACSSNEPEPSVDAPEPATAYHFNSRRLSGNERFSFALETLSDEKSIADEQTGLLALQDIEDMSQQLQLYQDALQAVGDFMLTPDKSTKLYRQAYLVHARILLRMGRVEEGVESFRTALREWEECTNPSVICCYANTLHEERMYLEYAIENYNCAVEFDRALKEANFNMVWVLYQQVTERSFLRGVQNNGKTVTEQIFPHLREKEGQPEVRRIAHAICLIADGEYDNAITELKAIQAEEPSGASLRPHGEYRNIPVYIATAMWRRDGNFDAAKPYLDDFCHRNRKRPRYVIDSVLGIIGITRHGDQSYLGGDPYYTSKYLVDAGFTKDPKVRAEVSDSDIAHLLDLYQMGLERHGDAEGAKKLCQEIVEEFFPETPGGANAMCSLAHLYVRLDNDLDAAEHAYLRIIVETRYDLWVKRAEWGLKDIWQKRRSPLTRIIDKARKMVGQQPVGKGANQQEVEERLNRIYDQLSQES